MPIFTWSEAIYHYTHAHTHTWCTHIHSYTYTRTHTWCTYSHTCTCIHTRVRARSMHMHTVMLKGDAHTSKQHAHYSYTHIHTHIWHIWTHAGTYMCNHMLMNKTWESSLLVAFARQCYLWWWWVMWLCSGWAHTRNIAICFTRKLWEWWLWSSYYKTRIVHLCKVVRHWWKAFRTLKYSTSHVFNACSEHSYRNVQYPEHSHDVECVSVHT